MTEVVAITDAEEGPKSLVSLPMQNGHNREHVIGVYGMGLIIYEWVVGGNKDSIICM